MSTARDLTALGLGVLFAIGLGISGMTQPGKVVGFLDFGGAWDPSLAFVMAGAVGTYFVLFRGIQRYPAPLFAREFAFPKKRNIDVKLVVGATVFGIGWGISGYCPGPAFTSLGSATLPAVVVSGSMMAGMLLYGMLARWLHGSRPYPPS